MGDAPFAYDGTLKLTFNPKLPRRFLKNGQASFTFLGHTTVTYHDETGTGIAGKTPSKIIIDGDTEQPILSGQITGALAESVRDRKIQRIDIYYL